MSVFDDQPLVRPETPPRGGDPGATRGRAIWIGAAIAAAVLVGAVARWWTLDEAGPPVVPAANVSSGTEVALAPPPPALPPLGEMDPYLRVLLGTLSSRPELSRWLATDDLIRQIAVVIDRLSQGATPAKELRALAPAADFETARRGRSRVIDAASYRRYDGLAETAASLDAVAVVRVYRTIRPRMGEAYRALGRSEDDWDRAVGLAVETLAATPTVNDPVTLVEGPGATWAFADPALEALDAAQKQLLRMGPANAARVKAKLREIETELNRR